MLNFRMKQPRAIINRVAQSFQTMMLHAHMRWSEVADESLWPKALQYAVAVSTLYYAY